MSFDIFDTVLTRRLSCPADVFSILDERLRKEKIRVPPFGLFRILRMRCERWSRRFDLNREVLLPDIYRLIGRFLFWSEKQCKRAAELECEIEASVLCATPFGRKAIEEARSQGRKIAFISDMYLEQNFLRTVLTRENLSHEGELIAVSGEWKCSKADQTIWPAVLKKCEISAEDLFHQGDNLSSDVASPQRHGIAAKRLGTAEVSRWEQWQKTRSPLSVEKWGGISAISRMARTACDDTDDYWTQLGTGLLGPLLIGFTSWVLAQAKKDGVQTLWFLSRDGWLFYLAAQIINRDPALRLHYVGVNRLQLRFAQEDRRPLEDLLSGSRKVTWKLLSERLGFSDAETLDLQAAAGVSASSGDRLSAAQQQQLLSLLAQPQWSELSKRKSRESGENVKAYIQQCLATTQGVLGIVDIGWAGRTQDGLKQFCPPLSQGYYLGLSGQEPHDASKRAWLFDANAKEGAISLNFFQRMIEVLVGGVSGPLRCYEQVEGTWQARFDTSEQGEHAPGRATMQQAALAFVKACQQPDYANWWTMETMETFASWNLKELLEHPSASDAIHFKDWQITTDDAHQDSIHPAMGFDFARIKSCLQGEQAWGWLWPQAALQNSPALSRAVMKAAWTLRQLRRG